MPALEGITVHILCDEEPLEEYATSSKPESPSAISCWVASEKDKIFKLKYEFESHDECGWAAKLYCDGVFVICSLVKPPVKSSIVDSAGIYFGMCPLMFRESLETDNPDATHADVNLLGTIKVEFWRIEPNWTTKKVTVNRLQTTINDAPVHESKKMLGSHRVRLGEPVPGGKGEKPVAAISYLDTAYYAAFEFLYRPKALLQALGHAPLPAPASNRSVKRSASVLSLSNSESETDEEEENLKARLHKIKQEKEERRRGKEGRHSKHQNKRPKVEESEIVVPPGAKGEVVDLSSD